MIKNKKKINIAVCVVMLVLTITAARGQYISEILDYTPAPGQRINTLPWGVPSSANTLVGGIDGTLTLGAFGGSVVFRFAEPVENHPDNPYGADFTIFGNPSAGWSEPGIVSVMKDENNNGLPDDTWYELAGSDHYFSSTISDYQVTYINPHEPANDIPWTDNQGNEGFIFSNPLFTQPYYPVYDSFPGIDSNSYTLKGKRIEGFIDSTDAIYVTSHKRAFGYADNQLRGAPPYILPDNPYTPEKENSGGDAFDISWAIDDQGNYTELDCIHFVKVHTAIMANAGWLGEISTDITGAVDVEPDSTITGIVDRIVIKDLPGVIDTSAWQLEPFVFHMGRLQPDKTVNWSSNMQEATVDENNLLTVTKSGELKLTASLQDNPAITTTITIMVSLPPSTVNEHSLTEFHIFPNPATDMLQIKNAGGAFIRIRNINGEDVYIDKDYREGNDINLAFLPAGLYIVQIRSNHSIRSYKLMKIRQ